MDRAKFARELGAWLRLAREQRRLSLHGVEVRSGGRWTAVVVGSYERGDRAVTVERLDGLARFYGVGVLSLWPGEDMREAPPVSPGKATRAA